MLHLRTTPVVLLSAALVALAGQATAQTFDVLPSLPGFPGVSANSVSRNGQYMAGTCEGPGGTSRAVRWTAALTPQQMTSYGDTDRAWGVSDNGVVAGESDEQIVVWGGDGNGGDAQLGPGVAYGVASDGSGAVGYTVLANGHRKAFRYHLPNIFNLMIDVADDTDSTAYNITPDGANAVGVSWHETSLGYLESKAIRYYIGHAVVQTPPAGYTVSEATDLSDSGEVVVGLTSCCHSVAPIPARWTAEAFATVTGEPNGVATGCSFDGSVIVGEGPGGAYVWDAVQGERYLSDLLIAAGYPMDDYFLARATDVSADGAVVVGFGYQGNVQFGWRVMLNAIRCDVVDFNGDTIFPDAQDIYDFLTVFSGGACPTGSCGDIDFNNDGILPDTADIQSFLRVFAGGACA
ncbi:MAG: hypothetical protein U0637_00855 [Phycisphaerales bacterium]